MANRWTGDFDAVLELSPSGADRLLAAFHRKGHAAPGEQRGPYLPHSLWLNLPHHGDTAGRNVRGHLRLQISTLSARVPERPGESRVTASAEVYSRFRPAAGSDPVPELAHGTVSVTAAVSVVECEGVVLIQSRARADDVEVEFTPAPGSGMSAADVGFAEEVVRDFLHNVPEQIQVRVGPLGGGSFGIGALAFRTLRRGRASAFALLLGLGRRPGPPPSGDDVDEVFVHGGEDAALALGRDFLARILRELGREPLAGVRVSGRRLGVSFSAEPDPDSLRVELQSGRLRVSVDGAGKVGGFSFEFRLVQHFGLEARAGDLALTFAGDPDLVITKGNRLLRLVIGLLEGRILSKLQAAAGDLILATNAALNRVVDESLGRILSELQLPDAALAFTRASIDPDGVVFGATLDIGPRAGVVVSFTDAVEPSSRLTIAGRHLQLNAFHSWIPGGTIERYRWTEVRADGSVANQIEERHSFVTRVPLRAAPVVAAYAWPPSSWCCEVSGTQVVSGSSSPVQVSFTVCGTSVAVPGIDLPGRLRLPVRVPDGKGGALADLDPWGTFRPHAFVKDEAQRGVLLVHHAGEAVQESVKILRAVLSRRADEPTPVFATVVAEEPAARPPASAAGEIAFTHDPEGSWRERFRLERPGATVILGPRGKELWRDGGPLRAEELEKVLAGLPRGKSKPPLRRHLGLRPRHGALAPEFVFPCGPPRMEIATRKMRGREIVVCFWTTWSQAAVEELRRLHAAPTRNGTLVLCVNDGEDPASAARFLKSCELDVRFVPDPERAIARSYGVTCWPTVVRIDRHGRIADVRFGLELERDAPKREDERAVWGE